MTDGPACFRPDSSCPAVLRIPLTFAHFEYGALTLSRSPFHVIPLDSLLMLSWSFNPVPKNGLGCFPFARRYSGNHFCFLFLRVLRCFSSPSSSRDTYVFGIRCHPSWMTGSPIRISADLCFLTAPRSVSPFGASFFSPRWLGIHRTPFPT